MLCVTECYIGCIKWKEAKAALAKRAPGVWKSDATSQSDAPKAQRIGPSAELTDLGEGWNQIVRGERVIKASTTPTPKSKPIPQPGTVLPCSLK